MPVKKAPVVAAERRILKGRERRLSLIRGDDDASKGKTSGRALSVRSAMVVYVYIYFRIDGNKERDLGVSSPFCMLGHSYMFAS